MQRIARKLCLVGFPAVIAACIVLYTYEHLPWPWGAGTLPGGLSDANDDGSAFDRSMQWQLGVLGSAMAVGFSGMIFLVVGSLLWLISRLRASGLRSGQLP